MNIIEVVTDIDDKEFFPYTMEHLVRCCKCKYSDRNTFCTFYKTEHNIGIYPPITSQHYCSYGVFTAEERKKIFKELESEDYHNKAER